MNTKTKRFVTIAGIVISASSIMFLNNQPEEQEEKTFNYDMDFRNAPVLADYTPEETEVSEVSESEFVPDPMVWDIYYELESDTEIAETNFYDDLELLALITEAEAEGESELGKRLVIDTVLNRCRSDKFPSTISDVVYQMGQYEATWNGRIEQVEETEETCQLVLEELQSESNTEVLFFSSQGYNGPTHLFQEQNHYFSK